MTLRDHPRLCGEKVPSPAFRRSCMGSPPPMRGKVGHVHERFRRVGITPAYAGKSQLALRIPAALWDHPRLCGEKVLLSQLKSTTLGSPPPMWGKAQQRYVRLADVGITPAYAGKSGDVWVLFKACWGSPPLMRGKAAPEVKERKHGRITPAYAGKRAPRPACASPQRDHPRLCGEKFLPIPIKPILLGSPPPMRGKAI